MLGGMPGARHRRSYSQAGERWLNEVNIQNTDHYHKSVLSGGINI